jgi:hypothetical protein
VFAGCLWSFALLLLPTGAAKVAGSHAAREALGSAGLPSSSLVVRLLGVGEIALAVIAVAVGGRAGAVAIAAAYAGFCWFSVRLHRRPGAAACGCFGSRSDAPVGRTHIAVTALAACVCAVAATSPAGSAASVLRAQPLAGVPFVALVACGSWLVFLLLTEVPRLELAAAAFDRSGTGGATR